jgi:hypothetical protein
MTQYCFLRLKSDITQEEEKEWNWVLANRRIRTTGSTDGPLNYNSRQSVINVWLIIWRCEWESQTISADNENN